MVRNAIVAAALGLAVAGCAHASASTTAIEPSASVSAPMHSLAGHWTGTMWETGGSFYQGQTPLDQGQTPLDVQINDNGNSAERWGEVVGASAALERTRS